MTGVVGIPPHLGITPRVTLAVAPLRISLAGGGTDLPSFAHEYGGSVVSFGIDRCVSVACFPREFNRMIRSRFSVVDAADGHPFDGNGLAEALVGRYFATAGLQLCSMADVPGGTGLGSSASFGVALLHALKHSANAMPSPAELAEGAAEAEIEVLGRPVGKHDHYIAALGGMQLLQISRGGVAARAIKPHPAVIDFVNDRLLLFYTGIARNAGVILQAQDTSTRGGDADVLESLKAIRGLVPDMVNCLDEGSVDDIGPILDEHWKRKARLSSGVSSRMVDDAYRVALDAGANGGKLVGAGGGGFLLVSCRRGRENDVRAALGALKMTELQFGYRHAGSTAAALDL